MKDLNDTMQLALSCGFSHAGMLDVDTIDLKKEVRDACEENKCNQYGTNWACPPGCGTLSECEEKIRKYQRGLILQTSCELEDSFDFEAMEELHKKHTALINDFASKIKEIYPNAMVIGAGSCEICEKCTYPDKPCRFPNKMVSSMEALGMLVNEVCSSNHLPYYYGPNTLTYIGCVLTD